MRDLGSLLRQAVQEGVADRLGIGPDAEFLEDSAAERAHRLRTERQLGSDLLHGLARRGHAQHAKFPGRQGLVHRLIASADDHRQQLGQRRADVAAAATIAATSILFAAEPAVPWQRKIRRLGQTNMTEHDPAVLDVEQWADYWASLKIDAVMVSVTGILAF